MVLLDDNFATIVAAVEEGRVIYDNIRKFVKYLLTTNSSELWLMLVAPFLGMPLPLLPLQILWINLVTDGPTALTLGVEPAERGVMQRPPYPPKESIFARALGSHVVWVGILMATLTLGVGYGYWQANDDRWRTMVFTTLAFSQMAHVTRDSVQHRFALHHRFPVESLVGGGGRGNRVAAAGGRLRACCSTVCSTRFRYPAAIWHWRRSSQAPCLPPWRSRNCCAGERIESSQSRRRRTPSSRDRYRTDATAGLRLDAHGRLVRPTLIRASTTRQPWPAGRAITGLRSSSTISGTSSARRDTRSRTSRSASTSAAGWPR